MRNSNAVYGLHAVTSRLRRLPETVKAIWVARKKVDKKLGYILELARLNNIQIFETDSSALENMVGRKHQGIVAQIDKSKSVQQTIEGVMEANDGLPLFLILDGVQDPHNLGACLRVADAMGVAAVLAPKDKSVGITSTVEKTASGAANVVPYISVTNLARTIRKLKNFGVWVVGMKQGVPKSVFGCDLRRGVAIVVGSEGRGLRRLTEETCDEIVGIPMFGSVESLNLSVAAGICLYEVNRQRL